MSHDFYISPHEYQEALCNGVSAPLLELRVRTLAWPRAKAIATPPQPKKRLDRKWVAEAERNGICYSTFVYRINQLGWEQEKAALTPMPNRKEQARKARESYRKYPAELVELAKSRGISYSTFRSRINRGWTLEEAAGKPVMSAAEIGHSTVQKLKQRGR